MLDRNLNFDNQFHFTSLGCARNLVDSEVMIGQLLKAGFEATDLPNQADILVVNTCGFLQAARDEGFSVLEELFAVKKKKAKVVVAGCMVNQCKNELLERFPQIHALIGSGDVEKILEAVLSKEPKELLSQTKSYLEWGEVPRTLSTPKHYAYLKIAEGCKKRCAFCIIPTIKGPLRSKSDEQVLKEFRALLNRGVFEIILIAQDLGDYGKDRKEKGALATLLRKMLDVKENFWIRLLYLYPDEIDEELISVIKSDSRICPYLDMPIQHINDSILKAMHRKTSKKQILDTLQLLREEIPEISIRTSLMVGFPGESDEQFEELAEFVKVAQLDQVGIFQFSSEKEAYAANLPHQIPPKIKQKRFERLAQIQKKALIKKNQKKIGRKVLALIEGEHPDSPLLLTARHAGQCPEIDGQIIINDARNGAKIGQLYEVEITDVLEYDFLGRTLEPIRKKEPNPLACL